MSKKECILVTGATGNIGTEVVHHLASTVVDGEVRVATRDPGSPRAKLLGRFNPRVVTPIAFDANDEDLLRQACAGVTKVCLIVPFTGSMGEWQEKVMEAVASVGSPEYVVKVSVTGARAPDSDPPPGLIPSAHWQGEESIRSRGIAATMIRPTIFMQHFLMAPGLYQRGSDAFYLPIGDAGVAFLDCRDISALAARLLVAEPEQRKPHEGQAYELTGPAPVTAAEMSEVISAVAGRLVRHVDGMEAFTEHCEKLGVPDTLKYVYGEASEGWFSKVEHDGYTQVLGRRPGSFAKFASDHAAYFQEDCA